MIKGLLVFLIFFTHLLMSYSAWKFPLSALLGSLVICYLGRQVWPATWRDWLGLRIPLRDAILAIALTPILMTFLYCAVRAIASAKYLHYLPPFVEHGFLNSVYFQPLGQTLNEEMLFGAFLLFALRWKFNRVPEIFQATLVAMSFAVLHYVFYAWIVRSEFAGRLNPGALFALFAIGLLRNTLILKNGHIAYSWSLHFSINVIGLLGQYSLVVGDELKEPEVFNLVLGSQPAAILSAVVLVTCWMVLSFAAQQPQREGHPF